MNLEHFKPGRLFLTGGGLWRVTDVGARIVSAIRLD